MKSRMLIALFCCCLVWVGLQLSAHSAPLADVKTGGKDGAPLAILFLSQGPQIDPTYAKELTAQGYNYAVGSLLDHYSPDFLHKFNVFVVDLMPSAGAEYDVFGERLLHYFETMRLIFQYAREGAGVLIYTHQNESGSYRAARWNAVMEPWGIRMLNACIRDPQHVGVAFGHQDEAGTPDPAIDWTEKLTAHPITAGLRRIYYPSANARWDDCYATTPLVGDAQWTSLVQAMPGSVSAIQLHGAWYPTDEQPTPMSLAAVRALGQGRLAALAISPIYTHRAGYSDKSGVNSELYFPQYNGMVLRTGDGAVPSDTGKMISAMYRWLAGDSGARGFGGFKTGDQLITLPTTTTEFQRQFKPVLDFDTMTMPPPWKHTATRVDVGENTYYPEGPDPRVPGDIHYYKALIGVHSAASDGTGQVADYVAAAKAAGYCCVAFTENFEKLTPKAYQQLIDDCRQQSTDDCVCLPGYEVQDKDNNSYLLINSPFYLYAPWLTPDGKRLVHTHVLCLSMGGQFTVVHHPESNPLPVDRLKHYMGISVYTYRHRELIDNSLHAYAWQAQNASNPLPVAVHAVYAPAEVAEAAVTGFQQILPSDTVKQAVGYFVGGGHFFECPARYMLSEGPIVTDFVINPKDYGPESEHRMHFRVDVGAHDTAPLKSVTLYDGYDVVRRWLPTGMDFHARADFQHSQQHQFYLVVEDQQGKRAITATMRTVAPRYTYRCGDRQNWLGSEAWQNHYTGTFLLGRLDISMPIVGTPEGSSLWPDLPGANMAVKLEHQFSSADVVIADAVVDEKYITARWRDVGLDARPSLASKPSSVYAGVVHWSSFTSGKEQQAFPTVCEFDITLKRDVEPANPAGLFPGFGSLRDKLFVMVSPDGKVTRREIDPAEVIDIPVGALAGGYLALTPGLRIDHGKFGLAPHVAPDGMVYAGTRLHARFLIMDTITGEYNVETASSAFEKSPEGVLRALGFAPDAPYRLTITRGTVTRGDFPLAATMDHGGVAGRVETAATLPFDLPLQLTDVNPNWLAGIWQEGQPIRYAGVYHSMAWPRLDVSHLGKFYAGNLLCANDPRIKLDIVKWDAHAIEIEVHNPTSVDIDTAIFTPAEMSGYLPVNTKPMHIPAGSTIYVTP